MMNKKLLMSAIAVIILIGGIFIFTGKVPMAVEDDAKGATGNRLSDYRPMIYVRDNLYAETADVVNSPPDKALSVGAIEKLVPQNEAMPQENFTSNVMPVGSEIYGEETDQSVIYVKLSDGKYSVYEAVK